VISVIWTYTGLVFAALILEGASRVTPPAKAEVDLGSTSNQCGEAGRPCRKTVRGFPRFHLDRRPALPGPTECRHRRFPANPEGTGITCTNR
jgi:hypothetical protein